MSMGLRRCLSRLIGRTLRGWVPFAPRLQLPSWWSLQALHRSRTGPHQKNRKWTADARMEEEKEEKGKGKGKEQGNEKEGARSPSTFEFLVQDESGQEIKVCLRKEGDKDPELRPEIPGAPPFEWSKIKKFNAVTGDLYIMLFDGVAATAPPEVVPEIVSWLGGHGLSRAQITKEMEAEISKLISGGAKQVQ